MPFNADIIHLRSAKYRTRLHDLPPDELWKRECLKFRTLAGSSTAFCFSAFMLLPTCGLSSTGLALSGRKAHIAWQKRKMVIDEIDHRNLPRYEKKARDLLIPMGIATTVFTTVGIIDLVCFMGTSSAVISDAGNGLAGAFHGAINHPAEFFAAAAQGAHLELEQLLNLPGAGSDLTVGGRNVLEQGHEALTQAPANSTAVAAGVTSELQHPFHGVGSGVGALRAEVSHAMRECVDSVAPYAANTNTLALDSGIHSVADLQNGQVSAEISGIAAGMTAMDITITTAATSAIQVTPVGQTAMDNNVDAGPPLPPRPRPMTDTMNRERRVANHNARMSPLGICASKVAAAIAEEEKAEAQGEDQRQGVWARLGWKSNTTAKQTAADQVEAFRQALNDARRVLWGENRRAFAFLSPNGMPISQLIVVAECRRHHLQNSNGEGQTEVVDNQTCCRFCPKRIDVHSEAYYHCCECSHCPRSGGGGGHRRRNTAAPTWMSICEFCVVVRGCSCTQKRDHVLLRKGCLFGKLQCGDEAKGMKDSTAEELMKELTTDDKGR